MPVDLESLKSRVHLTASVDELSRVYDRVKQAIANLSTDERDSFLLIAEREILGARGHKATFKFGYNVYDNAPKCIICNSKVDKDNRGIIVISRWENSMLWVTYHEECLDGQFYEMDFDLLTGEVTSIIGLT